LARDGKPGQKGAWKQAQDSERRSVDDGRAGGWMDRQCKTVPGRAVRGE
jgi:hypothetical protein